MKKIIYIISPSSQSVVMKIHISCVGINGGFPRNIKTDKKLQILSEKIPEKVNYTFYILLE